MRRFEFSLQTLLELRERRLLEVRKRLAVKRQKIAEENNRMIEIRDRLKNFQTGEAERRPEYTSADMLKWSVDYRFRLKKDLLKSGQSIQKLNKEAEDIRREAVEAERKKKTLEIIKEKRYLAWLKEYRKKEQETIDDISQKIISQER